ncbi:MAG TPA: matrixin family metalloprotease, partial [Bryobacteraceae bacterium]|nr:matrixin family metalloprotease [Bryobacteraceae bacterium]
MMRRSWLLLLAFALISPGQELHLKTGARAPRAGIAVPARRKAHHIVQFDHPPGASDLSALTSAGAVVTAVVPDNAVMIVGSVDIPGATDLGELAAQEKLSPSLVPVGQQLAIVEFHSDVSPAAQGAVAAAENLLLQRPPVLLAWHAIVDATVDQLTLLAAHDEVAYIFPADPSLLTQTGLMSCAGMLTLAGPIAQYANIIHGWSLETGGFAHLNYVLGDLTPKVPETTTASEILRALDAWSAVTNVTFQQGTDPAGARTVLIKFASGSHGDQFPFASNSGVLAHTFYPVPINAESIAGDMHLNADENWHAGGDVDIYSVVLHEAGHALGLGHTDNPGDVMYPYYRKGMVLSAHDIGAVQALYGKPAGSLISVAPAAPITLATLAPTRPPVSLSINPIPIPGQAAQIAVTGTVAGGIAPLTIQWQTDHGYSGSVLPVAGTWSIPAIALVPGTNTLTVTVFDSVDQTTTASTIITRLQ